MTSKSRRGRAALCLSCENKSYWFVAILKPNAERSMEKHWYICKNCYEGNKWQTATKIKEHITRSGSSTGSKKRVSKPKGSPSQAVWEASIAATSSSNSKDTNW